MTILFTLREVLDIMEFRLGGLYLQEMRDLRGGGATLAEVGKLFIFLILLKTLKRRGATLAEVFFLATLAEVGKK